MFVTSMSTLNNSRYVSGEFQLKDGCIIDCLPYLCLCASLMLTLLVPDVGPESASLITIYAAIFALIAACITTVWIASEFAI